MLSACCSRRPPFAAWLAFAAAVVCSAAIAFGKPESIESGPTNKADHRQAVQSPVFDAWIDVERHMCVEVRFTVRREDVDRAAGHTRNFSTQQDLRDVVLETADYTGGKYDEGHLVALMLRAGSEHWEDVNDTSTHVPQARKLNRQTIRRLESHIADLAESKGRCDVRVICLFERPMPQLDGADEPHEVPSGFIYELTCCWETDTYRFPNTEEVDPDPEKYRVRSGP